MPRRKNVKVVESFGHEWSRFKNDKAELESTLHAQFSAYSAPLKNFVIGPNAVAADFGAGSGRWDKYFARLVKTLIVVEPSSDAIAVAKKNLHNEINIIFKNESIEECSIENHSLDLAISLGVLHHTDNTEIALGKINEKLKPGGIFLCYLYYDLENKPAWYRTIWKLSDVIRKVFSKLPKSLKIVFAEIIAFTVYLPFARVALLAQKTGADSTLIPLHHYAKMPIYMMRNDALDRFGTQVERRYNRAQISHLLLATGFNTTTLQFSELEPFWTFAVRKNF